MPGNLPFPVLFQNKHFTIINKPAGLPVYSKTSDTFSLEQAIAPLAHKGKGPWLAHRLDQDTSGCLLIATRKQALLEAQHHFANHTARKTYWAIVHGTPDASNGLIDLPLYKHNTKEGWRMEVDLKKGQPAQTQWHILGHDNHKAQTYTWLALTPLTGRTHQLRVHCAAQSWPIVGDIWYGTGYDEGRLLHLHSYSLALPLEPHIAATAAPPDHMLPALTRCGYKETSGL